MIAKKPRQIPSTANSAMPAFVASGKLESLLVGAVRPWSQATTSHHLVLAYQPGWQSMADLSSIARLVRVLDSRIGTFIVPATHRNRASRKVAATRPTLVASTGPLTAFRPLRGRIYQGLPIPKFEQLKRLHAAGIPVPLTTVLGLETVLDPAVWGEFVVVKPTDMPSSSHAAGINLFRTHRVRFAPRADYPKDHPGRLGPMVVQQYIDTGERLTTYRVLSFFGEPIYAMLMRSTIQRVDLGSPDAVIEAAPIAYQADADRERLLIRDADVLAMARAAHEAFPEIPMIGCDIIREARTGNLYVLELNPGGNTWHFSSDSAREMRARMGPEQVEKMRQQFQALRTVAIALANRTIAEAE
jgi:hypothetical protein